MERQSLPTATRPMLPSDIEGPGGYRRRLSCVAWRVHRSGAEGASRRAFREYPVGRVRASTRTARCRRRTPITADRVVYNRGSFRCLAPERGSGHETTRTVVPRGYDLVVRVNPAGCSGTPPGVCVPPPQIEEAHVKKLKEWFRARNSSGTLRIAKWIRVRFYTSVLRTIAERVGAGISTAAVIGMLVDPVRNRWAGIAVGLFYSAARKPKGGKQ